MIIYLVERECQDYDEYDGHVVRANNPQQAIELCAAHPGDEGAGAWLSSEVTPIGAVLPADDGIAQGNPGIILSSFNAG
jgi:hypothetical protein